MCTLKAVLHFVVFEREPTNVHGLVKNQCRTTIHINIITVQLDMAILSMFPIAD